MRIAFVGGMLAPLVFVAGFLVEGMVHPGYDGASQFVSELSIGPHGWVQNANFFASGVLIALFAFGLRRHLGSTASATATFLVFELLGACLAASAFFTTDPSTTFVRTAHGQVHGILGALVFVCMPTSCFAVLPQLGRLGNITELRAWTVGAGVVLIAGTVLLKVSEAPALPLFVWKGLVQRGELIIYFSWLFVLAYRFAATPTPPARPFRARP
jgi:hypothetical protein